MPHDLDPPFGKDDVEILARDAAFQGFFRLERLTLRHRAYDGSWVGPVTRELFQRGTAAAVLPYDPATGRVLLVEQFRVGALDWRHSPWCLELIAGMADVDGESTPELIRREAMEEAGIELLALQEIFRYMPSPGGSDERLILFVGRADLREVGGVFGNPHEGEDIRVVSLHVDEIPALLESGRVDNAASLIALQWLQIHKSELDTRWQDKA